MNIVKVLNIPKFARLLPVLPLLVASASACPDCLLKNSGGVIEPQTVAAKLAFSASTLFLLGIFLFVVGFMVWTMIKTCRDLDQERTHAFASPAVASQPLRSREV